MPDLPRGTVTFLFTDIEGSTSLVQRLGDGYGRLLGDHRHLLRVAVEDAGGVEVDCRADEFFGGFSGAQDAVRAAVSAQRALKLHRWPDGLQPAVRMGIHTGEPALADEGYLGLDVHRAARICSAANGGQVLISETTHNVLADTVVAGVSFSDLGKHDLKGLQGPERIFQARRRRPSVGVSAPARRRHRRARARCLRGPRAGARRDGSRAAASGTLGPAQRWGHRTPSRGAGLAGQGASARDDAGRPEGAGRARRRPIYKRALSGPG